MEEKMVFEVSDNHGKENMTLEQISNGLRVSGMFMTMLRRCKVGDDYFYDEINLRFVRIE